MDWLPNDWRAFVEILILAIGIYYAVMLVRGTRGAPVVTGFLLVLMVLTVLARALDLEVFGRLLGNFLRSSPWP
ncbi:MAG TPA: hypothetical protein PK640_01820 [Verrucomicrobiota bacterium]|nr:hypothetical protein [Verrucomicrobiota bacterium]